VALLTQVSSAGVNAFLSKKGGGPSLKETWTNEKDGIIPMLKAGRTDIFDGCIWPKDHQSVVNHADKLIKEKRHL
jgi:hypothetical protein